MGHGRKKKRTHVTPTEEELDKIPRSLVVKSGSVGRTVSALVADVRQVMEPNTAARLKERKTNKIKDYVAVASQLGLTHLMIFSQTEVGTNMRVGRIPRGPTLSFRVNKYSLAKDCLRLQKLPRTSGTEYKSSPLVILNNFAGESKGKEFKLMTAMLQNLFPAINPSAMTLAEARRVVLFNYNEATGMVDFRHYAIVVKPVGVTKGVKRVIMAKNMPSLANFDDISEYVLREAFASESDVEDGPENSVTLAQDYVGRGNKKNEQRAIRLMELGPRMELKLLKVQAGLCEGDILYHGYIHKTKEEIEKAERLRQIKMTQQARRRQQQEANVERKSKDQKKKKGSKFDMAKNEPTQDDSEPEEGMSELESDSDASVESDDDAGVPAGSAAADDFGADEFNEDELFDEGSSGDNDSFDEDEDDDDSDEEDRKPAKRAKKDTSFSKGKPKGKPKGKGGSKRR